MARVSPQDSSAGTAIIVASALSNLLASTLGLILVVTGLVVFVSLLSVLRLWPAMALVAIVVTTLICAQVHKHARLSETPSAHHTSASLEIETALLPAHPTYSSSYSSSITSTQQQAASTNRRRLSAHYRRTTPEGIHFPPTRDGLTPQ